MIGDRVRIGSTGTIAESPDSIIHVYRPKMDETKNFIEAGDNTCIVEHAGGVKAGSTGTIDGTPIRVHRSQLKDYSGVPGLGSVDSVLFYPVFLDTYQQIGWFPSDNIKIV